ncbi:SipW-dependent-type signal peptide-containing protein [Arthrobacter sp. SAFR-014]|uniref:SipW-dependent-type signal peptide-containing protein n=1 Tax=unclassified Arthrobacter TaxID=235627 RepID=UPI003F7C780A
MSKTEIAPVTASPSADNSKKRKLKAILAGGLVLGIGAAVTLAAWNDSEFVKGAFGSGHFKMVGSKDGVIPFENYDTSGAANALSFSKGFGNLSRDEVVAAPYVVHLDADSTYSGEVTVESAAGSTGTEELRYGIIEVLSVAGCSTAAVPTLENTVVPINTEFNTDPGEGSFTLNKPVEGEAGANVYLCVLVSATSDLPQDTTATATWELVAKSNS